MPKYTIFVAYINTMKRINKIFTILALLLISIPAYSQWRLGINVAYENTGAVWKYDGKNQGVKNISGFSLGPTVAYEAVEEYLDVQTGLSFAMSGFAIQDNSIFGNNHLMSYEELITFYYLQVPVYAVGKLPVRDVSLLLEVGPILSAGVGSRSERTYRVDGVEYTEESKENLFKEAMYPFNCLIHFGIGFEYVGMKVTAGYNLGVFNVMRDEAKRSDLKTDGFFVSIGYVFDFD